VISFLRLFGLVDAWLWLDWLFLLNIVNWIIFGQSIAGGCEK
jgi:hypothetical protein